MSGGEGLGLQYIFLGDIFSLLQEVRLLERSSTPVGSIWNSPGGDRASNHVVFWDESLRGGWSSSWGVGKLAYCHSPEKVGETWPVAEAMWVERERLGQVGNVSRTEAYGFLTQEKTGFQIKVLSPFGWAGLGLSIINPGTQGKRPLDAVLGALTSWEMDMTEGP